VIRIVIADDHGLVRTGLEQWLQSVSDIDVVGVAVDGREAVDLACALLPDVVLMDLAMPVMSGVDATAEITARAPEVRVIALTTSHDPQLVNAVLAAGATGYLLKDVEPEVLVSSIRAAGRGGLVLSPPVAADLFRGERATSSAYEGLTPREREVLALIAAGESNKRIALLLGISDKTVKAHCSRVFKRLGVRDRTQAAIWAMRAGPDAGDVG
jgi:DNA-binding NarL/FixJ family response regulator